MRCKACNAELDDFESTRKDFDTGEFFDLCGQCWSESRDAELDIDTNSCYTITLDTTEDDE